MIDSTSIHTSCAAYIGGANKPQMARLVGDAVDEFSLGAIPPRPAGHTPNTPAVLARAVAKHEKYDLLASLMNLQHAAGRAPCAAAVVPVVLSHRGEVGTEAFDLIERCTTRFKHTKRFQHDLEGMTPVDAATKFRREFKDALISALAKCHGAVLLAARVRGPLMRASARS